MPQINVGGATITLPDGASPEAVKKAVEHFRSTPEFDKLVDKKRGAPARVRLTVGGSPEQDRLANLKRFYPDAVHYGDQNFVYSDPETGRPTLYNPTGLDWGDLASVGREGAEFAGGTMGAIAGVPFGGPFGGAIGAGAGAAAGASLFDTVMNAQGRIDTRGPLAVLSDAVSAFGVNAAGQKLGELIGFAAKKVIGGAKDGAKELVDRFRALDIEPPAGAASGSRAIGQIEQMLTATPSSAATMQAQAEKVLGQVSDAADDLAMRFGPVMTPQGAGATIVDAAKGAAKRFGAEQERLYDEAFNLIGKDTPVPLTAVEDLLTTMQRELARAPSAMADAYGPTINKLEQLVDDASDTGIVFDALRQIRTAIGRQMDEPLLSQGASLQQAGLRRIYGALTADLSAAAKAAGPGAAKKLEAADAFTRKWMENSAKLMQKIDRFDADEKAWRFAMSSARDGGTTLQKLRQQFEPEEWDVVAGTVLSRLGKATPGAQDATGEAFSVATFLTNWSKLAPEAKSALFGGERYRALVEPLNTLVEAVSSLKGMSRLSNSSNTAHMLIGYTTLMSALGGLGALASGVTTGDVKGGAVAGAMLGVLGPKAAAKLITSPKFVDWLVSPVTSRRALSAHMARLWGIAEAEPELREAIHGFALAMRNAPRPASDALPQIESPAPARSPVPQPQPAPAPQPVAPSNGAPIVQAGQPL